jgi:uncharacterized protein YdbL (DUF1318 family)
MMEHSRKLGEAGIGQIGHIQRQSMTELARVETANTEHYRKYTQKQVIDALEQSRGMLSHAARRLGCSRTTLNAYIEEYKEIAQAKKDAHEEVNDVTELKLFDAIQRGEAWAICFRLKTQAKDRGYIEKAEISGPGGRPVCIKLVYDE